MGKEKAKAKGKAPVRDPSPVPEQEEAPEPETIEPPTPEPVRYTTAGIVTQDRKANIPAIEKYGLIHRDQWANRKRLLDDGTLQPQAKKAKTEARPPVKLKLPTTRGTRKATPEEATQETGDKPQDRKVLDRIDNVRKQLVSLHDLIAIEELEALTDAQESLKDAISKIMEYTGVLKADDADNLSSPFILSP